MVAALKHTLLLLFFTGTHWILFPRLTLRVQRHLERDPVFFSTTQISRQGQNLMARRTQSRSTRKAYQGKQGCKRQKSMRGIPDNPYGEVKRNVSLSLTPTALDGLDQLSQTRQISRSELIERLGQGLFALVEVPKENRKFHCVLDE